MEQTLLQQAPTPNPHPADGADNRLVPVTVDGEIKHVRRGKYLVSEFKATIGVPADYELDEVVAGEFRPLADDATIHIKGEEVFVSHVRRGGSS